ncbi:MAG: class I SAM-dependent methyltransferase [Gemmatimonadota bacterium]
MTPAGRPTLRRRPAASRRVTVGGLLQAAERHLKAHDVELPDTSALWLLATALGVRDPDALDARRRQTVDAAVAARFWELIDRRETHEPFQYIVGEADFRGLLFEVEHGVFLPRTQSERLCDEVEAWARRRRRPPGGYRIADLGAGSGALGISLARGPLKPSLVLAADISSRALELVARNARRHDVADRVHPVGGDWLSMVRPVPFFDIICVVPPYLNPGDEQYLSVESLRWEPLETFFGEPSGDELLLKILGQAAKRLRPGGVVACQLDAEQIPMLEATVNGDPEHPLTIEWILHDEDGDEDAVLAVRV